jgi:hypothetical protein
MPMIGAIVGWGKPSMMLSMEVGIMAADVGARVREATAGVRGAAAGGGDTSND